MDRRNRISLDPAIRDGKPCVKGTRITVYDVVEYLAGGMSEAEMLSDFPDISRDDIRACLAFAAEGGGWPAARILRDVPCRTCGAAYDPVVVDQTGHRVSPLCGGEPESRWMVQCWSCGSWAGFGDDGERVEGGVVPVPTGARRRPHSSR